MRPKVAPKYLTLADAATYCGYPRQRFKRIVSEFALPVYGPDGDRFRPDDLDSFMESPQSFKIVDQARRNRTFTPVKA